MCLKWQNVVKQSKIEGGGCGLFCLGKCVDLVALQTGM